MPNNHSNVIKLVENLLDRLEKSEFELFLVQSWFIWNQRNTVLYGGSFKETKWLNKRASDYHKDFQQAQRQLAIPAATTEPLGSHHHNQASNSTLMRLPLLSRTVLDLVQ